MDESDVSFVATKSVEVIFAAESVVSSVDPPMDEWPSLDILTAEQNKKRLLYSEGLYNPGSGEICAEYITLSASSVERHPYYKYPPVIDPGIEVALLGPEPKVTYTDDGQALYLALCEEMNQTPVRSFYRGLLQEKIDLRYYCIDPYGFRAMAKALQYNNTVEELDLTDNFLNHDACYHMGDMLLSNRVLTVLNLRGCRIGPKGLRRLLNNLEYNKSLKVLDLSYNKLGDDGMEHLAKAIHLGLNEPSQSKTAKVKNLDVNMLVEYVKRKWPDKRLPPTPPPTPPPIIEPPPPPKRKEKKGKGKKNGPVEPRSPAAAELRGRTVACVTQPGLVRFIIIYCFQIISD
ncbi:hypothetical protein PYW07_003583 [Mythimna separata]|uniref:Uncharacterized protein n=1 Tax=Mythimna separata TaxID=271217 RepID=A0AAD7YNS4_MYTSE|nr:hypothetical protein PYW07_003583 [Mythimna separata]